MIPLADYGVAATFALMMAVVEMASTFGLQQQIIQSRHGDDPHFQAALQGFQLIRGVIAGVVMLLIAGPMARFLGIPEVIWAYQLLAIVPVLNAMQHFDIHRMNRQMVFAPMLLTGALPALLSTLAVWPLAIWFDDWQILLYAILLQASLGTLVSHLTAERPWRLAYDPAIIAESLRFGWPLLANAILMFLIFQGDKMIVGRELGMETLAIFAMGVTLTLTPTLVMARTVQNLMLPRLSTVKEDPAEFQKQAMMTIELVLVCGLAFLAIVMLVGRAVTDTLLGSSYSELLQLIYLFALPQVIRVFKAAPSLIALAQGKTSNALIANLVRCLSLPLCWYVAAGSGEIEAILWIIVASEAFSYGAAAMMLPSTFIRATVLTHILVTCLVIGCSILALSQTAFIMPWPIWLVTAMLGGVCLALMPQLRNYVMILFVKRLSKTKG
jgi:O-antigen/teichoic acid export membrane protein